MNREAMRSWMQAVLDTTGWSAKRWGKEAKTSPSNITRLLKSPGEASMPNSATLAKLASVAPIRPPTFGVVTTTAGRAEEIPHIPRDKIVTNLGQDRDDIDLRRMVERPIVEGIGPLPIYASAEGGNGDMILAFDPIEYAKRPAPLEGVREAYGFYCIGDSMSPRYEQGDLILVHPGKPVNRGDDVLVILISEDNSHQALVKKYDRKTDETVFLKQFNPPKAVELSRKKVHSINLIIGRYNKPG